MANRGFWWFTPFHHGHTIAEFRESHPTHADILQRSINSKTGGLLKGVLAGTTAGYLACIQVEKRLFDALPPDFCCSNHCQSNSNFFDVYNRLVVFGSPYRVRMR